jgi:MATE family multidrug resistance protein
MEHKLIDSSWKSVMNVTIPMMLSAMSTNLMFIIDRAMLAGYSIDAMNAVTMSSNFVCIFVLMFIGISGTAEIFIGQYNGAKQYERLAIPVWQMVYLSLAVSLIAVPVAYFSDYINTLPNYYLKDGVEYQKILMYFSSLPPLRVALSTFFIGQGKTKIITFTISISATLNVLLDYLLIYGVTDIIPPMGVRGAAMATVIAEFASITILAIVFFSKKNRTLYRTLASYSLNKELFWKCVRIGTPLSLGNFTSMLAWYIVQTAVSYVSKDTATIYNIGINIYVFSMFVGDGINKATAAICSNMIGRGDLASIEKTRKIFVTISWAFGFLMFVPLVFFPESIFKMLEMFPDNLSHLYSEIKIVLYIVILSVVLETLLLSTWGILTAGGDTKYPIITYQSCLWGLVVFPICILYYINALNYVPIIYAFTALCEALAQFFIYKRYKSLKWYNKLI